MDISKELIEKAKACHSVDELMALAKENEIELSFEEAELFLADFKEGEITTEELDNVAGGQEGCSAPEGYDNVYWEKEDDVEFLFKEGDYVEAFATLCSRHTATCKVVSIKKEKFAEGWMDRYWLEKVPGCRAPFVKGWNSRCCIQKQ